MIGYGRLMLSEMMVAGFACRELRMTDHFAGAGKIGRNLDRFAITPLKVVGRRVDVAHAVDPGSAIYFPLLRAGRTSVTVHDMIPYLAAAGRLDGFRPSRLGKELMRTLVARFRQSDGVVAASQNTRRDLIELADVDPDKIHVIPNAMFHDLRRASRSEITAYLARSRLPQDRPLILNIGRNFYKNREGVVEIFGRLRNLGSPAHLVFVSSPDATVTEAIARMGVSDHVSFLDQVAAGDMSALYSAASALLFPSLYEGFGYPVLEAQACGTPVVCSNAGSLAEVAGEAAAVFDVADADGMAEALARILHDSAFAGQLVEAGHRNLPKYSVAQWRASYADYFAKMQRL
ncbi:glycosyltransferase family 4 protein [Tropicimonas sediminicola]|uniref:Glycosyltransferase involved in cell wall bisynthesis n=1 Tax=Tropicimonas sediminicola TaxID=1031541 RepID=A0A239M219_9RHOB|nr:glycosyltransferase family 1 protein [Tropicimonas sediminicola]SNT36766.1 Glycosyltransferase involved in cell wall bisynthesis [Tropicimonas sediminicola]